MTTAYTPLLGLALPVQGELVGTWGDVVDNAITSYVDTAVAGTQTITGDSNVTLSLTNGSSSATNLAQVGAGTTGSAQYAVINCTGARTAVRTITVPASSKQYIIINATTGGYGVKIVGAGPTTGLTIPPSTVATVAWNGSDFVAASNPYVNYSAGQIAATGGGTVVNGTGNVFVGSNAGNIAATGFAVTLLSNNTVIGTNAGRTFTNSAAAGIGSQNIIIGYVAGQRDSVSLGNDNILIGTYAGLSLPTNINSAVVIGGSLPDESTVATGDVLIGSVGTGGSNGNTLLNAVKGANSVGFEKLTVSSDYTKFTGGFGAKAPTTVSTSTYTVLVDAYSLIFAATCTVTLPSASANSGRVLILKNRTANAVTSASSNVVPIASATAGTAILAATAGKFSYLQSDGTNWITMMSN